MEQLVGAALVVLGGVLGVVGWIVSPITKTAEKLGEEWASEVAEKVFADPRLERTLRELRGTQRQEGRFTSYASLWETMRPLAIYDTSQVNRKSMEELSQNLSNWYFSRDGGHMLTFHNRDLYFALQEVVHAAAKSEEQWTADRIGQDAKETFCRLLERRRCNGALGLIRHLDEFEERTVVDGKAPEWPSPELNGHAKAWRTDISELGKRWSDLSEEEFFPVLQQVGSVLRTSMANDIEARLR